ncbi:hypothetical protein N8766_05260 [bacterium]|jgi:hypothetical protein|nr:hypothetical protein [Verrucomicrobiota bacterium]MDA7511214.1 hypothetical protein [Verrucomicrobiota bacterium]MDA7633500.1 hypothetical protein [bacterium]MDB4746075.1 hypothetical protein [Verrucomicrobiota bacterium]
MKTSRYIARVIGIVGILFILIVLASRGTMLDNLVEIMRDPGFLVQAGFMNLILGVAIVVGHNVWDGSWRVVITVIGYLALLKGIVLLAWPDVLVELSEGMIKSGMMPVQMLFATAFYGWLAWLGFRPDRQKSGEPTEQQTVSPTT